jgi:ABC-2 type transport system ATP-binding protein
MSRGSSNVGYLPQKLALYGELTVADNLRFRADIYGLPAPDLQVQRALQAFGLEDRRHQRVAHLSGGWARRLHLAAVLIHTPAVILLDEPTAGLDGESREDVWRRIQAFADDGAGVIVNTHDLLEAERCSRVVLFRAGRIVRQGSPAEISGSAPVQAALVQSANPGNLRGLLASDPSVLCVAPHGRRWRIVVMNEAFSGIRSRLAADGATVICDETRLADVALLNEKGVSASVSAA